MKMGRTKRSKFGRLISVRLGLKEYLSVILDRVEAGFAMNFPS